MLRKTCLIILGLLPIIGYPVEKENIVNFSELNFQNNSEYLLEASYRYLDFINQISRGEEFSQCEKAATLLTTDCKKILNGQTLTKNREDFVSDLLTIYENKGGWSVYPADIIIASSSNTVVLRLIIEMENFGTHTAIVILRYNSNYLITEINEVFSKVIGDYNL